MKALDWLDYSFESLKLMVIGANHDKRLVKDIQDFARHQPSVAAGLQTQMNGVTRNNNEACEKQIAVIRENIRNERKRISEERADVDPSYAAAFEQKANEAEAYIASLQ